ncbi:cobalamin-binding protein [Aliikangiella sp. IMCC44653]
MRLFQNKSWLIVLSCIFSSVVSAQESPAQTAVKKIVALSPSSVEMLFYIGLGDSIVATVEHADFPAAAKKIPRIGNYTGIQIERVVALQPDLIIAWKGGNKASDLKKLESLGFKMFYTNPTSINQVVVEMQRLAKTLGTATYSSKMIETFSKKYQTVVKQYATKKTVRTFYQLWHEPLRTVGADSWVESLIKDCNGENVFSDSEVSYPLVSMESVLHKNPQVVIIPNHSGSDQSNLAIWNQWKAIEAVKESRIFELDGAKILRAGPRAIDGLVELCETIDSARR